LDSLTHKILLISCSAPKKKGRMKAEELYSPSIIFRRQLQYGRKNGFEVYILSAKYGLLGPEEEIETYDLTLNKMKKKEREDWYKKVGLQIKRKFGNNVVHVLVGERYLGFERFCQNRVIRILDKMPIGWRCHWLKENA
jgi:hypothetical protein